MNRASRQPCLGWMLALAAALHCAAAPPGIVINHSPASSGRYIGSPSLVVLPGGGYLASHDFFGPASGEFESPETLVFRSEDRGRTWQKAATIQPLFWAGLFVHRGAVFIMGVDRHNGRIVIRRSNDQGRAWTTPVEGHRGFLTERAGYHTAPTPVVEHRGRLWRAFEDSAAGRETEVRFQPLLLSAPADSDLLDPASWTFARSLARGPGWLGGRFNSWLEGNAVIRPDGGLANLLRVDVTALPEKAALLACGADGQFEPFDPDAGFIDFPGGAKKFTVRFDPESRAYWSMASVVPPEFQGRGKPSEIRNTLALVRSENLREWELRAVLLQHPDSKTHGFQYPDWQFDGPDIIAAVRTAFDDAGGGARNAHDANYLTFHRFPHFRTLR